MNKNAWTIIMDNPVIMDLSGCKYADSIHETIRKAFGFPAYYGKNWDAFWDCIQDFFFDPKPREIQIIGFYSLPADLQKYCTPMLSLLQDIHNEHPEIVFRIVS